MNWGQQNTSGCRECITSSWATMPCEDLVTRVGGQNMISVSDCVRGDMSWGIVPGGVVRICCPTYTGFNNKNIHSEHAIVTTHDTAWCTKCSFTLASCSCASVHVFAVDSVHQGSRRAFDSLICLVAWQLDNTNTIRLLCQFCRFLSSLCQTQF